MSMGLSWWSGAPETQLGREFPSLFPHRFWVLFASWDVAGKPVYCSRQSGKTVQNGLNAGEGSPHTLIPVLL